jgi:hypothetical protein
MNLPRFTVFVVHSLAGITLLALPTPAALAHLASSANALGQLSAALSGDQAVQRNRLSANATSSVGSSEYPEPAYSIAASNGSSRMRLALTAIGLTLMRCETFTIFLEGTFS